MKQGWDQYASQKRVKQKGYLRKYKNRDAGGKATEASNSNSTLNCWQEQEEEVKLVYRPPSEEMKTKYDPLILADAWIVNLKDIQDGKSTSEEDPLTHQEGRQGIQGDDQGTERANKSSKGTNKRRCKAKKTAKKEVI